MMLVERLNKTPAIGHVLPLLLLQVAKWLALAAISVGAVVSAAWVTGTLRPDQQPTQSSGDAGAVEPAVAEAAAATAAAAATEPEQSLLEVACRILTPVSKVIASHHSHVCC